MIYETRVIKPISVLNIYKEKKRKKKYRQRQEDTVESMKSVLSFRHPRKRVNCFAIRRRLRVEIGKSDLRVDPA